MLAILASAAVLATSAAALSVGDAIVINSCEYEVYLANTPAADGGYSEIDKTLQSGDQYSQQWTELTNGDGWSLKLSKDTSFANIMQYEYTFHDDGIIWYDLSDVNGNPWDGDWEITAESPSSSCSPKQQAYRYATDDAYGMQACPQDSVITVTLCSGEGQNNGTAASASSSVAAEISSEATATSTFTTPTSSIQATSASSTTVHYSHTWMQADIVASTPVSSPSPTTFATLSTSSASAVTTSPDGVVVTDVDTEVVTEIVTATAYAKRHAHHPRRHAHA